MEALNHPATLALAALVTLFAAPSTALADDDVPGPTAPIAPIAQPAELCPAGYVRNAYGFCARYEEGSPAPAPVTDAPIAPSSPSSQSSPALPASPSEDPAARLSREDNDHPPVKPEDAPPASPRPRRPLLALGIAGAAELAVSWVGSALVVGGTTTCTGSIKLYGGSDWACHSYSGLLFIPVAGPIIALAANGGNRTHLGGEMEFYGAATVLNLAGFISMVTGFAYTVPPAPSNERPGSTTSLRWQVSPYVQGTATGMAVSGTFF